MLLRPKIHLLTLQTLKENYEASLIDISLVGSATGGARLIFGPLAALSVDCFGFKVTGCIALWVGFFSSY